MKTIISLIIALFLLGSPIFKQGDLVRKKRTNVVGRIAEIHKSHGLHSAPHYLVIFITGKDSGYSKWLYESLLEEVK